MSQPPSSPYQPQPGPGQPQGQPFDQRPSAPPDGAFGPPVPVPPPPQQPPDQQRQGGFVPPAPGTPPQQGPGQPPPAGGGFGPPDAPDALTAPAFPAAAAPSPYGPGAATPPPPPQPYVPTAPLRPGGPGRARIVIVIAAVLALLIGGGVTAVLLMGGDDGTDPGPGPSPSPSPTGREAEADGPTGPTDASLAWQSPAPDVTQAEISEDPRSIWFSGDNVVRTIDDAISANNLETGEEAWSLPLELGEGKCQSSRNASEDRIAVLQGRDCEELTIIDIATGEEVTSFSVGSGFGDAGVPAILGDTVAVGHGYGSDAFSISTGRQIWQTDVGDVCPDTAYAVIDDMFISRADCDFGEDGGIIRATTQDGEEVWRWRYEDFEGETIYVKSIISVDPLIVVDHPDEDYELERILVVDENHQSVERALDYDSERYVTPCSLASLAECNSVAVHDGFLYLASYNGEENEVVGFDLSTGNADFEVEPYADERDQAARDEGRMRLLIQPFAVADGEILAYQRDDLDDLRPGTVVSIDPETEEATPIMNLDPEASEQEGSVSSMSPFDRLYLWHDDTLLLAPVSFSSLQDPAEDPSLLVYH
jgi:outer membrane protein assembly factor BamB